MSSELRLGPVSYLVLGIVALRGPTTPYDLKRFVKLSIGHFWPFPHTQLYVEPARLAEAGLLDEEREETGRRRRHYSLTEAGRLRLAEWLAEPVTSPTEYRDLGLLKLFFSELAEPPQIVALARAQSTAQRRQLAQYEALLERFGDRPEYARRLLAAELGARLARVAAEFWDEIAEREQAQRVGDTGRSAA
jgi:PadR family transcriptional regulator, regulatory protein AphA